MVMNASLQRRGKDRHLSAWVAILVPVIVLAGFARTYYLKGFFDTPAIPGLLVHLHGAVMTSWVVLFVTQVWLVASHRVRAHQRLGIFGAILAGVIVCVGVVTALSAAARGVTDGPPPLVFLAVPLGDMFVFAILVGTALYFRRRMNIHKRLMLVAAINLLTPAIGRIPLNFIENGGPLIYFGLTDVCLLAVVAVDTIRNRRLHPVFIWSVPLIIATQPLRLMLAGTGLWLRIATALVALVK